MKKQLTFILISTAIVSSACWSSTPTKTNTNQTAANTANSVAINASPANSVVANTAPANVAATPASANSPAATVAAYYQAMVKRDETAFRKVLSAATVAEFARDAKAEGAKSLVDYFVDFSAPPPRPFETRNERISGDVAMIEIKDGEKWTPNRLVRENGEWKLDLTLATTQQMVDSTK